jgi:GNAT superfamily N-acetyltransferase
MAGEDGILHERTSPEALCGAYENGLAVVLMVDGEPAGYLAVWPVSMECFEIGSGFVRKDLQSQGLGSMLYKHMSTLPALNGKIAFAISKNPAAVKAGIKAGLMPHPDWDHPVPYQLTCGECSWVAEGEKPICSHRNTTCTLRILRKS